MFKIMSDTIAAISTALGEAGIGIVRVSGEKSLSIMREVFLECPSEVKARYAYFGHVTDNENKVIDEAIFLYMKAPFSYTGEDMLEVQAHGSNISLKLILRSLIAAGARIADPGEFTKLAFLNGKIDLSQAEAVIDIIKSRTEFTLGIAERQKEGLISSEIGRSRERLLNILAQMTVNIDYPDEDIEQESYDMYIMDLSEIKCDIEKILKSASVGRIARDGIRIAIAGRPNVGKSSLMNAMLGEGRVIVTDIPGTTRDTIEESVNIDGIPVVLIDTAGIRDTEDKVERIGIERTREAIDEADMSILVIDGSEELGDDDKEIIKLFSNLGIDKLIVVINKSDIGNAVDASAIKAELPKAHIINTSLMGSAAMDSANTVYETISNIYNIKEYSSGESAVLSSERHIASLESARFSLAQAIDLLECGEAIEIAELEVHYAYDELGHVIGEAVGDEILDAVFSKFCLGK